MLVSDSAIAMEAECGGIQASNLFDEIHLSKARKKWMLTYAGEAEDSASLVDIGEARTTIVLESATVDVDGTTNYIYIYVCMRRGPDRSSRKP